MTSPDSVLATNNLLVIPILRGSFWRDRPRFPTCSRLGLSLFALYQSEMHHSPPVLPTSRSFTCPRAVEMPLDTNLCTFSSWQSVPLMLPVYTQSLLLAPGTRRVRDKAFHPRLYLQIQSASAAPPYTPASGRAPAPLVSLLRLWVWSPACSFAQCAWNKSANQRARLPFLSAQDVPRLPAPPESSRSPRHRGRTRRRC